MTDTPQSIYDFVFKGLLAKQSLDRASSPLLRANSSDAWNIEEALSLRQLAEQHVAPARSMAIVYTAIAAFENSVRDLISGVLLENVGANWWKTCVSDKVRQRAENRLAEEKQVRWHTQRGDAPINYTILPDLISVIRNQWVHFEPYLHSVEWAANVFDAVERSRNVIMHSGTLDREDIERLGIYIRDWIKQVGA